MRRGHVQSAPNLLAPKDDLKHHPNHSPTQGPGANMQLFLKLVQDQRDASIEEDARKPKIAVILDDMGSRVEKATSPLPSPTKPSPKLLRCSTDVKRSPGAPPRERRPPGSPEDEVQRLRRQIFASVAARKSLELMLLSLGKEKEIMAGEIAKKAGELSWMEQTISEIREENEILTEKLRVCAAEHRERKGGGGGGGTGESQVNAALQERNKSLSEQLLKTMDGYKSMKRKLKEAMAENGKLQARVAELAGGMAAAAPESVRGGDGEDGRFRQGA